MQMFEQGIRLGGGGGGGGRIKSHRKGKSQLAGDSPALRLLWGDVIAGREPRRSCPPSTELPASGTSSEQPAKLMDWRPDGGEIKSGQRDQFR